jgi:LuxR family transcriptional regulator, maltose regulon positive regulatory protein
MAADLTQALWETKTSVPQLRPHSVSRKGLIQTGRASDCRVIGVTAPAGFGKTTLLTQWALSEDRPVAWVSLNRFDDDPGALLSLLAYAFAGVMPGNADLVADVRGLGVSALGRAAPRLASALKVSQVPFVLMVDDLHELQSPACHDVLGVVIEGIPRGSQLVAASRSEQPHVPRLRAAGDAREFLMSDLALDADGAEEIFAGVHVSVTHELAAAVAARTEGWPVGLYLAALIARDSAGALTVSGQDPYVADYLYRESLAVVSEDAKHFLLCTSVLDQMCAPLCDALLGEHGAQDNLRRLEASNLFLIPLDRRREWYRYHPLFREFLLGELRRADPEAIPKMHLRAADWYESNGSPATALEHLLNTTERDRCVKLVAELILPTYQVGQMSTVQRWLSMLGDSAIEEYPPLAVLAGYIAIYSGHTADAERWSAIVDAASFDLVPADGTASFDSARALFRGFTCPEGPGQMMTDASFAVAQEPEWSMWRDAALYVYAEAYLLGGEVDEAIALFAESSTMAATRGNTDSVVGSEAELALLAMDRGQWAEAAERTDLALAALDEYRMQDYPTSVLAFVAAARVALHGGDRDQTDRQLSRAMRARPSLTYTLPILAVRARLHIAKVYWASGDPGAARHLLLEIDDILVRRPNLGVLVSEVSAFRDALTASEQPTAASRSPLTPAELRLLPYLQTHLTIREIAERLHVSRNTVSSQVGSIYRKLGVSSRNAAVQEATAVGLLGG